MFVKFRYLLENRIKEANHDIYGTSREETGGSAVLYDGEKFILPELDKKEPLTATEPEIPPQKEPAETIEQNPEAQVPQAPKADEPKPEAPSAQVPETLVETEEPKPIEIQDVERDPYFGRTAEETYNHDLEFLNFCSSENGGIKVGKNNEGQVTWEYTMNDGTHCKRIYNPDKSYLQEENTYGHVKITKHNKFGQFID